MMIFILKSTIMASVYTSSVYAFDAPAIRGSAGVSCTAQYDCCQSGTQAGKNSVNNLWASDPFYGNCDNVWDLSASADEMKDAQYPANTGNWKVQAYNECARDYGVDPQVATIEKQCLGDDPEQCIELGETAASIIVFANVCDGYSAAKQQDYKQDCRDVAYGICKGSINDKIKQQCNGKSVTTSELNDLMNLCEEQVNTMVPITTDIPTFMPTKKPSGNRSGRNECASGSPYPSGSFCYTARQQCCSSVKKYDSWSTFCEYYGFTYPGELSQGIFPWTFLNTVDCTMCGTSKCSSDESEIDVEGIEDELDGKAFPNDEDSADFEHGIVEGSEDYVDVTNVSEDMISPQ